jgi:hypothetical protein
MTIPRGGGDTPSDDYGLIGQEVVDRDGFSNLQLR